MSSRHIDIIDTYTYLSWVGSK